MVGVLIQLLELHVEALGNKEEEDRVWDIILQARARVQTYRRQIQVTTWKPLVLMSIALL